MLVDYFLLLYMSEVKILTDKSRLLLFSFLFIYVCMFLFYTDAADTMQSKLIRRRFVKNQDREKQSIYFAKIEERRSKLREKLEKERKFRREAQVCGCVD